MYSFKQVKQWQQAVISWYQYSGLSSLSQRKWMTLTFLTYPEQRIFWVLWDLSSEDNYKIKHSMLLRVLGDKRKFMMWKGVCWAVKHVDGAVQCTINALECIIQCYQHCTALATAPPTAPPPLTQLYHLSVRPCSQCSRASLDSSPPQLYFDHPTVNTWTLSIMLRDFVVVDNKDHKLDCKPMLIRFFVKSTR